MKHLAHQLYSKLFSLLMRSPRRNYVLGDIQSNDSGLWLATFLAESLADLFNNSLQKPSCQKTQEGDTNYHPVSLTSVAFKVFARILKRTIKPFLSMCTLLCLFGHAFPISKDY